MAGHPDDVVRELLAGRLDSGAVQRIQRAEKDPGRREQVIRLEQQRVGFADPILTCLQEHLFVVARGSGEPEILCDCGHAFGPWTRNWKEGALVRQRDDTRDGSVYAGPRGADPAWMILREFSCPGCGTLLDVEMVPPGYPFIDNFRPRLPERGAG